jgi:hypothetical protein
MFRLSYTDLDDVKSVTVVRVVVLKVVPAGASWDWVVAIDKVCKALRISPALESTMFLRVASET